MSIDQIIATAAGTLWHDRSTPASDALAPVLRRIGQALGASKVTLFHLDPGHRWVDAVAEYTEGTPGLGSRYSNADVGGILPMLGSGQTVRLLPGADDGLAEVAAEEGLEAIVAVPVRSHSGSAFVLAPEWSQSFTPPDAEVEGALARAARFCAEVHEDGERRARASDHERAMQHRQRLETIGQFAGSVAHDLNNLLTIMQYAAWILRSDDPGDEASRATSLDELDDAIRRGGELTRTLLLFSRDDAERPEVVDLRDVLGAVVAMASRLAAPQLGIELDQPSVALPVVAVRSTLEQALLNLLVNAMHASAEGGAAANRVLVSARADDGTVTVTVRDFGCGMPPDVLARASEPFFTTKPAGSGSGLGLAIVRRAVERARGRFALASTEGEGTTATLELPLGGDLTATHIDAAAQRLRGNENVLVVDDDAVVRRLLATLLGKAGYQVSLASDGDTALEHLARHPETALVITDVVMPVADGAELFGAVRERRPEQPILFCSGYTDRVLEGVPLDGPHTAFLAKPPRPAELLAVVRDLLGS
jgi:signal transduction histidine kinase